MAPYMTEQGSTRVFLNVGGVWYYYDAAQQPLGEGSTGVVYLGFNCETEDRVAIKRIKDPFTEIPQVRQCARYEASMVFHHPNILRMVGLCEAEEGVGPLFILSDYIAGITFEDHVKMRMQLFSAADRERRILADVRPILSGLQHMHDLGFVHRDVKPSNMMIDRGSRIKLTDLSIAARFGAGSVLEYAFTGTPEYAAPEQIPNGDGMPILIDGRADIYAFGVTLYELLTGTNPYVGATAEETLYNHKVLDLPEHPVLSASLYAILRRATDRDPARRYASAHELDEALANYQSEVRRARTAATAPAPEKQNEKKHNTGCLPMVAMLGVTVLLMLILI